MKGFFLCDKYFGYMNQLYFSCRPIIILFVQFYNAKYIIEILYKRKKNIIYILDKLICFLSNFNKQNIHQMFFFFKWDNIPIDLMPTLISQHKNLLYRNALHIRYTFLDHTAVTYRFQIAIKSQLDNNPPFTT